MTLSAELRQVCSPPRTRPLPANRHSRTGIVVLGSLALALICGGALAADPVTAKYFDQLRQRQLFGIAEGECLRMLSQEDLPSEERLNLTLELSRTFVAHAREASGDEQTRLWQRAKSVLQDFLEKEPEHPRRVLLDVQTAFINASHGETLRWLTERQPYDDTLRSRALSVLSDVLPQLTALEERLTTAIRSASSLRRSERQGLAPHELRTLLLNVRFRLAATLLDRANLLPSDSADRAAVLIDADEWLRKLAGGPPDDEMTWNSRLLLAQTYRLQGDLKRAHNLLADLGERELPSVLRDRVVAEEARVLLAGNQPAEAAQRLLEYRRSGMLPSGELSFLNARALLTLWDVAVNKDQPALAAELMEKVEVHVGRAERDLGSYWGQRCRQLLNQARDSRELGAKLAAAIERARSLYAAGRMDESISAYQAAATAAQEDGKTDLAADLEYTRASILFQQNRFGPAGEAFRQLTERYPTNRRTPQAHLLWGYCLGNLYEQRPAPAEREAYSKALTEHRRSFSGDPTAIEATWMLARLEESQGECVEALDLYRTIPLEHRHGPEAQVAVARCFEAALQRAREMGQPVRDLHAGAVNCLTAYLANGSPQGHSMPRQRAEVALRLARILLAATPPDFAKTDTALRRVFSLHSAAGGTQEGGASDGQSAATHSSWKTLLRTATQLHIVSLAGQQRMREAEALVQSLAEDSPEQVLAVLDGLMLVAHSANATTQRQLGSLQLLAAEILVSRQPDLTPAQRCRLDLCRAQAFAAIGQTSKAIGIYERLARETPGDEQLLRTLTGLLTESETPDHLRLAEANWRKLEGAEKPGSRAWLTARYHVALCSFRLREFDECEKLLRITRLLYPDLGGGELHTHFARLEQDLAKARQ